MICKKSGTQVSECDCPLCQSMCKKAPCIGTPSDIKRLIDNGYIHYLGVTTWSAGTHIGIDTFLSVQIVKDDHGGCPLFKNGKCTIHDIKPTDGKLASCKVLHWDRKKPTYYHIIADTWNGLHNLKLMKFIINAVYKYESVNPKNNEYSDRIINL